jgi:subtilisin family serine protease
MGVRQRIRSRTTRCALLCFAFAGVLGAGSSLAAPPSAPPGRYVVVLRSDVDVVATVADHKRSVGAAVTATYRAALKGYAAQLTPVAVNALELDPRVRFLSPDVDVDAAGDAVPTGVARIQNNADLGPQLLAQATTTGANVAVLDTGIDSSHPELDVAGGVNCTSDKLDATTDPAGHGTIVAGIIAARQNGVGIVGVAPDTRLWSVRVLKKNGSGSISGIICGLDWVTATRTDTDPTNDIAVANLSLTAKGSDDGACGTLNKDALHAAVCRATAAGVALVAAAGNDANDLARYLPAAYDEVVAVTAMTDLDGLEGGLASTTGTCVPRKETHRVADDTALYFSNYATIALDGFHTIAAPGTCITSTTPGGEYGVGSGTSFAAAHAAGVIARCFAGGACAGLSPAAVTADLVGNLTTYNQNDPAYGFAGDALHPEAGKHFGYLLHVCW